MQTNFTPSSLQDPGVAASEKILRTCVHCGFCTATCPTYVTLGNELDSPRGRIYLIKDMLENGRPADEQVVTHIDRCLSCLACMTTCPSGVHYMHLVDHARAHIEKTYKRPLQPADPQCAGDGAALSGALPRVALCARSSAVPLPALFKAIPPLKPIGGDAGTRAEDDRKANRIRQTGRASRRRREARPCRHPDRLRPAGTQARHQRGDDPAC
jgi:glycolate oxidase iron-sulfur subunit